LRIADCGLRIADWGLGINRRDAEAQRLKEEEEETEAFEGDYMDYRITWIKKLIHASIHAILQSM